jgi:catechol 2,3-dioxygenase-like lactoylglutathione lyase family enzyme
MSRTGPLGHFLAIAIPTTDISASVQFYERLGFTQFPTGDAWPHRYGVLGDGRIHLGLHERTESHAGGRNGHDTSQLEGPTVCFVHPGIAAQAERLQRSGLTPVQVHAAEESLHHLWLRDPAGHALLMQEARTFSPAPAAPGAHISCSSLCGSFAQLSLPEPDFDAAQQFWERAGFVALAEEDAPYVHLPLTSDALDLAFHAPRSCDAALLVFECPDTAALAEPLQAQGIRPLARLPRGLARAGNLLLEAPEGTRLLLVPPR